MSSFILRICFPTRFCLTCSSFSKPYSSRAFPNSETKYESIIRILSKLGCYDAAVITLLRRNPELRVYSLSEWRTLAYFMRDYGVPAHNVLRIITSFPDILDTPENILKQSVYELQAMGFSTQDQHKIIGSCPRVLENASSLQSLHRALREHFTSDDLLRVVRRSPSVLLANPTEVTQKFEFVTEVMKKHPKEIIYSRLFSHSLFHIRTRFNFLYRLAKYEIPDHMYRTKKIRNPPLKWIIDFDDRTFAKKLAYSEDCLSEYRAFVRMQQVEYPKPKDDEILTSSSDESDNESSDDDDSDDDDVD